MITESFLLFPAISTVISGQSTPENTGSLTPIPSVTSTTESSQIDGREQSPDNNIAAVNNPKSPYDTSGQGEGRDDLTDDSQSPEMVFRAL